MDSRTALTTYRAGVIGRTGRGNYGHGLDVAFLGLPNVELTAVADPDPDGLRAAQKRTGARRLFSDYRDMLGEEQLDLVSVCPRWVDCHAEMVIACAEAGVKGVFCEKPFARTLAEADAMIEACERNGVRVAVAHRRANPYEQHTKRLVNQDAIGELQVLRSHGKCDHRSGGLDLMVLGTHMMDSMRYVAASDVAWAHGHVTQDGREVTLDDIRDGDEGVGLLAGNGVAAYYAFKNGVTAHFESYPGDTSAGRSNRWFGFEVHGTEGIISVRNSPRAEMYVYPHGQWIPGEEDGRWQRVILDEWESPDDPEDSPTHRSNQMIVTELIEAIEERRDVVAASSDKDARAALEMIVAVHESQRFRNRVPFPLENRENPYETWRREPR